MELHDLLEKVTDRESFVRFVQALICDREKSVQLEKQNPEKYNWAGALGWKNGSIETYLDACLACFEDNRWKEENSEEITWKKFAIFLYGGKTYE